MYNIKKYKFKFNALNLKRPVFFFSHYKDHKNNVHYRMHEGYIESIHCNIWTKNKKEISYSVRRISTFDDIMQQWRKLEDGEWNVVTIYENVIPHQWAKNVLTFYPSKKSIETVKNFIL